MYLLDGSTGAAPSTTTKTSSMLVIITVIPL